MIPHLSVAVLGSRDGGATLDSEGKFLAFQGSISNPGLFTHGARIKTFVAI